MIWNVLIASFALANGLYDAGKYAEAATAYEQIEPKTAPVYFNMGNALFRQEDFGHAVLNYERARQLAPRDPDVLANLRFARQRLGVEEQPRFIQRIVASRTIDEWGRYELVALWLTVFAVAGGIWLPRLRTGMFLVAAGAGVTMASSAGVLIWDLRAPPAAIVISNAAARFAPTGDATVHFQLPEGAKVAIREDRGAWKYVERTDGQQGWVKSEVVEPVGIGAAK